MAVSESHNHIQWHADQADTWTAAIWQAVTGQPEYVWISDGHEWADLDIHP